MKPLYLCLLLVSLACIGCASGPSEKRLNIEYKQGFINLADYVEDNGRSNRQALLEHGIDLRSTVRIEASTREFDFDPELPYELEIDYIAFLSGNGYRMSLSDDGTFEFYFQTRQEVPAWPIPWQMAKFQLSANEKRLLAAQIERDAIENLDAYYVDEDVVDGGGYTVVLRQRSHEKRIGCNNHIPDQLCRTIAFIYRELLASHSEVVVAARTQNVAGPQLRFPGKN